MKTKELRTKAVTLNFSQREFLALLRQRENSTCPNMALYLRKRLLSKKIVTTYRNRSQDDILEEIAAIRKVLEKIRRDIELSTDEGSGQLTKQELLGTIQFQTNRLIPLVKKLLTIWLP